jgi:hypothetical protein
MINNTTTVIFILVIVVALAVRGWYYFSAQKVAVETPIVTESPQATTISETKTYRNEEWGFEFEYPEEWTFHENTFYSPASKFNLVGASPEERGHPNPIFPPVFINIVTVDFAVNATTKIRDMGAITSDIVMDDLVGMRYDYIEKVPRVLVDISFNQYNLFIVAREGYENVFNQILASFKFLK